MNTYYYAYKTSDGKRHEEKMRAKSRDEVFKALKERGIRAIKVVAADGSKANGEIRGVRKRVFAASVIGAALLTGLAVFFAFRAPAPATSSEISDTTRRQVIGDLGVIEKGIATGWADVFELEGERFLASFAIPGMKAAQRNTTEEELLKALRAPRSAQSAESDGIEARQIRAMVEGMKDELRRFLAANGTVKEYGQRLVERQEQEISFYNRAKQEVDAAVNSDMPQQQVISLWEDRNSKLRRLGVRTIPYPNEE